MRPVGFFGILCLLTAVVEATATASSDTDPLRLAVVAPPGEDHFARVAAGRLQQIALEGGLELVVETAPVTEAPDAVPDLFIMPVRSLATQVPALQVLELPFLFPSLEAVHPAVDGELGALLAREARARGWEIVAWWDEGMHVLSGLKRYDRVRNLKIREFLITRPDPVAEKQFRYWKAYARRVDPQDREAVLRECLIASRAATLQEIAREQLYRVHLSMSLTNHRYEGWVVVAPRERWTRLDEQTRKELNAVLREMTTWQRDDARRREAAALAELKSVGMTIHEVDAAEREAFRKPLPAFAELLPDALDTEMKRELLRLASVGTAAVVAPASGAAADTLREPAPATEARQGDQGSR
jgi:TRAP-type C4-dicarboxylate transport system substrate-binding protein